MDFSIIICTFNGSKRLPLSLESIKRLVVPEKSTGELIVVDNNSTDRTRSVVESFGPDMPFPVRYCFEPLQGLSYARNTGIKQAAGEVVVFTDDDCIVEPNWIVEILTEFRNDPDLMVLGGRVELYNKKDKPVTLRRLNEKRSFSSAIQTFTLLPGCNMAFRKVVSDTIGLFDVNYGAGRKIPSAEDSDFFYRAYGKGYKMAYFPNILIYHNHGRRTDMQVDKLTRGYVIGQGAFYCKHIFKGDFTAGHLFLIELKRNVKTILLNFSHYQAAVKSFNRLCALMTGFWYQLSVLLKKAKAR
ncbi:glycosyltransferase [uncultured Desulfosarcina sp.]|uniref:glycosyltransferase family 2 protein n=1 Tax=uncultured Desulfosarcina sp. TaxID=218289 RepID=UPI0029C83594|nr:glycosyltransferase [uncultured Desulfosarcina sp.]